MRRRLKLLIIVLVVLAAAFLGLLIAQAPPDSTATGYAPKIADKPATKLTTRMMIAGDVYWGRQINKTAKTQPKPYEWPFSGLHTFNRQDYDAWIVNLECPVTPHFVTPAQETGPLIFNCEPGYLPDFAKWFDIVSLSNNHSNNVNGVSGLLETRQALQANGVQYFGHFDNAVKSDICEVASVPVKLSNSQPSGEESLMPIAFCGFHGVFKVPTPDEIVVISQYSKFLPTIVMPHMGTEYKPTADSLKTAVYRSMVDAGADLVMGAHPHWVQNSEVYKDRLIFYSAGNFIFDQRFDEDVKRGAALDVTLSAELDENLEKWLALGGKCATFQDDCLAQAETQQLIKPVFSWKIDLLPRQSVDLIAQKGDEAIMNLLLERTNWTETSAGIKASAYYSGQR